jgi:hypothetical protein
MTKMFLMCSATLLLAVSCADSSSGVDRGKKLSALTAGEKTSLCKFSISEEGGAGKKICGATTLTVKTQAECEAQPGNSCTVAAIEDCVASIDGDPCKLLTTAECATVIQCSLVP